jgi:hypothetical protein
MPADKYIREQNWSTQNCSLPASAFQPRAVLFSRASESGSGSEPEPKLELERESKSGVGNHQPSQEVLVAAAAAAAGVFSFAIRKPAAPPWR